jgi:hypothetical protein
MNHLPSGLDEVPVCSLMSSCSTRLRIADCLPREALYGGVLLSSALSCVRREPFELQEPKHWISLLIL